MFFVIYKEDSGKGLDLVRSRFPLYISIFAIFVVFHISCNITIDRNPTLCLSLVTIWTVLCSEDCDNLFV